MNSNGGTLTTVVEQLRETRDALSVRRVFGDAYELDGVTIIPVARVGGGAGGGGGEGNKPDEAGSGFGTGFGLDVRAVGVYEVRNGEVEWKPAVDVTRLARNSQILAAIVVIALGLVLSRRR